MKSFALAMLLAFPAAAQISVVYWNGGVSQPVGASLNLGTAATGDTTDYRFQAVNSGTTAVTLQTLTVAGSGFALAGGFQATTLMPGKTYDFTIRFSPVAEGSHSAVLSVNAFTSILRATGAPAPSFALVMPDQILDIFGILRFGAPAGVTHETRLLLRNSHATAVTIQGVSLSGSGYRLANAIPAMTLAPGEQVPFTILFHAEKEGEYTARLSAGGRQLELVAAVFQPRLGIPRIVSDTVPPFGGRQVKLKLRFAEAALVAGKGVLRADFAGAFDDPAIQFQNGLREIPFTVPAGGSEAIFDGLAEAVIQTGTTAGILRLEALTESGAATETFSLPSLPIVVEEATARRDGSTLEIAISGYDNARTAGSLNFRFFDRSGNNIGGVITAALTDQFKAHFAQSALGGVFRIRASFPVTGDATMVGSVLVEAANAIGRTDLQRLTFP